MWSPAQMHAHMVCLTSSQHMLNVIEQWSWTLVKTRRKEKKKKNWEKRRGGSCIKADWNPSPRPPERRALRSNIFKVRRARGCAGDENVCTHLLRYVLQLCINTGVNVKECVCARVMDWNTLQMVKCVWCGAEREKRKRPNASQLGNTSMRNTGTPSRYDAALPSSQASDRSKQTSDRNVPD